MSEPITMEFLRRLQDQPAREEWRPDYVDRLWEELDALRAENARLRKEADSYRRTLCEEYDKREAADARVAELESELRRINCPRGCRS